VRILTALEDGDDSKCTPVGRFHDLAEDRFCLPVLKRAEVFSGSRNKRRKATRGSWRRGLGELRRIQWSSKEVPISPPDPYKLLHRGDYSDVERGGATSEDDGSDPDPAVDRHVDDRAQPHLRRLDLDVT
jgi:hypothetical protein